MATVARDTKETQIKAKLNVYGKGNSKIDTGISFLDHMLELFSKHGGFDLELKAKGDLNIDQHHTVEDVGIVLGQAFDKALDSRAGINRAGFFAMPMDESLAIAAIDLSGRPNLSFDVGFKSAKIGDLDSEMVYEFFDGFCNNLKCSLHVRSFSGRTDHHIIEGVFKGFARALKMACSKDKSLKGSIPSTKGLI